MVFLTVHTEFQGVNPAVMSSCCLPDLCPTALDKLIQMWIIQHNSVDLKEFYTVCIWFTLKGQDPDSTNPIHTEPLHALRADQIVTFEVNRYDLTLVQSVSWCVLCFLCRSWPLTLSSSSPEPPGLTSVRELWVRTNTTQQHIISEIKTRLRSHMAWVSRYADDVLLYCSSLLKM